ncbi:hypothetical protein CQ12_21440 [Bradyrhizobium jicamae]|uniref:Uncharacterized protein n=1 Tax=Bradyrhizobium jicamae TaxID=280332 RepID=A0A0R3LSE8_9BRAD|nr:hypothetical protein [Bradyrhizobium jicamae]KRR10834.1 hypothetical protein CQ12_21440 [Bradyrhizobium jicamae]
MTKSSPKIDAALLEDAIVEWRATDSITALAALVADAGLTIWLCRKDIKRLPRERKMAQALASLILLTRELKETRPAVLRSCIAKHHYGNAKSPFSAVDKIFRREFARGVKPEAEEIVRLICESHQRKAKHLARLQAVLTPLAEAATSTKSDATSTKSDVDRGPCDR